MAVLMGTLVHMHAKGFHSIVFIISPDFSRKIIWLKVAPFNSNSKVIARYNLEAVEKLAGNSIPVHSHTNL